MITRDTEISLFSTMLRIRMVESAIAEKYSEQEMRCPVHLSIGQEAPAAAFAHTVEKKDFAVSTHRGHAHFLAKGGSLESMIAEISCGFKFFELGLLSNSSIFPLVT